MLRDLGGLLKGLLLRLFRLFLLSLGAWLWLVLTLHAKKNNINVSGDNIISLQLL